MSSFSIDGLSSGLDTTAIIEQLMEVEAIPVRRLESRRDEMNDQIGAWTDLDNRLAELSSAITSVTDGGGTSVVVGEVSNPAVTATATGSGGTPGLYEMQVDQIASAHQLTSERFASAQDLVGDGRLSITSGHLGIGARRVDIGELETGHYSIEITSVVDGTATIVFNGQQHEVDADSDATLTNDDGSEITIRVSDGFTVGSAVISTMATDSATTFGEVADHFGEPGAAAAVQVVDTGDDSAAPLTLVVTARTPGIDNELVIDIDGTDLAAFEEIRAADDTIVTMGGGGLEIRRSDILVDGVVPGMTVDLSGAEVGETLRVSVSRDTTAIVENIRSVIDAANAVFSGVSAYGRSDPASGQSGLLTGEFALRRLESELRSAIGSVGTGSIVIPSQIGIETTLDGSITFDEEAFTEALATDFAGVQNFLIGNGEDSYLGRIQASISELTETQNLIESATTTLDNSIDEIEDTIASYERRLETAEAGFRRQFTAMETLLAQLNSQSAFLAGQLGSLG